MRAQALASADLKRGARVLVLGGSGGVGHFAVQLAKVHWAAHVAATASGRCAPRCGGP
jgi:NADPH:quinone reductase-like Zn-dependent oxidoreductase